MGKKLIFNHGFECLIIMKKKMLLCRVGLVGNGDWHNAMSITNWETHIEFVQQTHGLKGFGGAHFV